jgi:hypothetical protein
MAVVISVPAPSRESTSNILGVLGLVGLVLAVGGLTGSPWWSLLVGSLLLLALSWVGHQQVTAAAKRAAERAKSGAAAASTAPAPAAASAGG